MEKGLKSIIYSKTGQLTIPFATTSLQSSAYAKATIICRTLQNTVPAFILVGVREDGLELKLKFAPYIEGEISPHIFCCNLPRFINWFVEAF